MLYRCAKRNVDAEAEQSSYLSIGAASNSGSSAHGDTSPTKLKLERYRAQQRQALDGRRVQRSPMMATTTTAGDDSPTKRKLERLKEQQRIELLGSDGSKWPIHAAKPLNSGSPVHMVGSGRGRGNRGGGDGSSSSSSEEDLLDEERPSAQRRVYPHGMVSDHSDSIPVLTTAEPEPEHADTSASSDQEVAITNLAICIPAAEASGYTAADSSGAVSPSDTSTDAMKTLLHLEPRLKLSLVDNGGKLLLSEALYTPVFEVVAATSFTVGNAMRWISGGSPDGSVLKLPAECQRIVLPRHLVLEAAEKGNVGGSSAGAGGGALILELVTQKFEKKKKPRKESTRCWGYISADELLRPSPTGPHRQGHQLSLYKKPADMRRRKLHALPEDWKLSVAVDAGGVTADSSHSSRADSSSSPGGVLKLDLSPQQQMQSAGENSPSLPPESAHAVHAQPQQLQVDTSLSPLSPLPEQVELLKRNKISTSGAMQLAQEKEDMAEEVLRLRADAMEKDELAHMAIATMEQQQAQLEPSQRDRSEWSRLEELEMLQREQDARVWELVEVTDRLEKDQQAAEASAMSAVANATKLAVEQALAKQFPTGSTTPGPATASLSSSLPVHGDDDVGTPMAQPQPQPNLEKAAGACVTALAKMQEQMVALTERVEGLASELQQSKEREAVAEQTISTLTEQLSGLREEVQSVSETATAAKATAESAMSLQSLNKIESESTVPRLAASPPAPATSFMEIALSTGSNGGESTVTGVGTLASAHMEQQTSAARHEAARQQLALEEAQAEAQAQAEAEANLRQKKREVEKREREAKREATRLAREKASAERMQAKAAEAAALAERAAAAKAKAAARKKAAQEAQAEAAATAAAAAAEETATVAEAAEPEPKPPASTASTAAAAAPVPAIIPLV
eukprot:COSAG05_NODE_433_length_9859_cov_4.471004_2_plen_913_part_00